jgi:DNA-directed RNA polymerase specialized sigma24 family protein
MSASFQRDSSPTPTSFQHLLAWIDEGADSGGEKYLQMRQRLVLYFDRKDCPCPDDLADETLNRVARRLEEEGTITGAHPARYCYIVAKFVLLEHRRSPHYRQMSLDTRHEPGDPAFNDQPAAEDSAKRHQCLDVCLEKLNAEDRDLILEYYRGEQRAKIDRRRRLAARLGVTANALSIRACRIRNRLEECVRECCANQ